MIRRTIPELATRYQLEPTLRDVYVEGNFDKNVITWYLRRAGRHNMRVFEVDFVEVPPALVAARGLTDGNRQRVLTLAYELELAIGEGSRQATCIFDSDADYLLGDRWGNTLSFATDFSCMEMYLFDEIHLGKFLQLILEVNDVDVAQLITTYADILTELFLIRAASLSLRLPIRFLDFTACCKHAGSAIILDIPEFRRRLLDASNLRPQEVILMAEIERLRTHMKGDPRCYINGEDFIRLVEWDRRESLRKKELRNYEAVSAALRGCFEFDTVSRNRLFEALIERAS